MPTEPNKVDFMSLFVTKENILVVLGLFVIFLSIALIAGFPWGLLVLGVGLLIWGCIVAANKPKRPYSY